ncbi:hypothetical protein AvCA_40740 [Azotobacter vinelandii CA]|uniref:Uncharacterized protein n=2 Tax=Azotobacter vinelandii TaxID=354 RepID=C1DEA1_AZOVD|nr:hypothetical protein Avin_40740 [Azotobacter vinelandii DJ]AGK16073.1 hypothetical protein AvCA_40740 [Azotobacter vinelandii CA]AGK21771.1 hypothetical protein AvCA6_40740 [Azotobacter vinelandii CA6]
MRSDVCRGVLAGTGGNAARPNVARHG